MIHIDKDQVVAENENLRVMTSTGDYEDGALIEFYDVTNPDLVAGAYQAQCVKYGNMVYRFSDPVELGGAILVIDEASTHTAASYVRMTKELLTQMNSGTLEATSLDTVINTEQANMEDKREETIAPEEEIQTDEENEPTPEVSPEETTPKEGEVLGEEDTLEEVIPEVEVVPEVETVVPLVEDPIVPIIEESIPESTTTSMLLRKQAKRII